MRGNARYAISESLNMPVTIVSTDGHVSPPPMDYEGHFEPKYRGLLGDQFVKDILPLGVVLQHVSR